MRMMMNWQVALAELSDVKSQVEQLKPQITNLEGAKSWLERRLTETEVGAIFKQNLQFCLITRYAIQLLSYNSITVQQFTLLIVDSRTVGSVLALNQFKPADDEC